MPGKVFISYSSADQETADKLVAEIERRGIPCWISARDIPPGEDYQRAIVSALREASVFLLLFSENANKSTEIPRELALAGKYKKTVIPARVQDIVPSEAFAYQMTSAQFIDLFRDFDLKVNELCTRLAELLQISEHVAERIRQDDQRRLKQQRREAIRRKLKRVAAFVGVMLLVVGVAAAWWKYGRRSAARSTPSVSVAPAPVVATPSATSTPPVPTLESPTIAVSGKPQVTAPISSVVSAPAILSDPVQFAARQTSPSQYAQEIKSSLAKLATSNPSFVAGKYIDGGSQTYTLYGPGVSLPGQTCWSIELDAEPNLNKRYEAVWTTGPASLNPDLANQKDLDTLPEGFSYGFARQSNDEHALIGVREVDRAIQITTFVDDSSGWKQRDTFTVSASEK